MHFQSRKRLKMDGIYDKNHRLNNDKGYNKSIPLKRMSDGTDLKA